MFKTILTLVIVLSFQSLIGQTFAIAHKSHSGEPLEMHYDGIDRFGLTCPPIARVIKIENESDTATILYYGFEKKIYHRYRIEQHPIFNNPDLDMDSVMMTYPEEVEFIGFDKKSEIEDQKKEGLSPLSLPKRGQWPILLLLLLISIAWERMPFSAKRNPLASH